MRLPDWEERLAHLTHEAQSRRFAWGVFDCCTFAAEAVEAITGSKPVEVTWRSWREAVQVARERGGLREAVTNLFGSPLASPRLAQRGDIVLIDSLLPALGVVVGASALVPLQAGVQRIPPGDWVAAWRIE